MSNDLDRSSRAEPLKSDSKAPKVATPLTPTSPAPRHGLRTALALIVVALIGLVGWVWFRRHQAAEGALASGAGGRPGPGSFPIPVVPGVVVKQDVPIYLDGLGTVQAFNTVTIRCRVDGQIQRVAF